MKALLVLVAFFASAAPLKKSAAPSSRKPAQSQIEFFKFRVVYGEKKTSFDIRKTAAGAHISLTNSNGQNGERDISGADFSYIRNKLNSIAGPSNAIEFCRRTYYEFEMGEKSLLGCMGSKNTTASALHDVAEVLARLF